ncbi:S-layer homology domain-containing protein [Oscillibacter sp. PC13]|nr:S-layer homology domain-containing protein [Oscillibacter sp. PC13]
MAEHFQGTSYLLSFDLIIEVTDALNNQPERLNEIYEQLVSTVRKTNPNRIVMISPRVRSDAAYLQDLTIPTQANGYLMAEWHFYAVGPSKDNERKLWTTGTDAEKQLIQEKITLALAWQEATDVPTWVGAWMPGNYNDGDDYTVQEQAVFAPYMAQVLTDADIPFAVNADTHFYDRAANTWIPEMQPVFSVIYGNGALPFTDVPADAWYRSGVMYVYQNRLFSGTSSTAFSPDAFMTRQHLWMVLARMSGHRPASMAARIWAMESGVSDGSTPFAVVSRQQFVTSLWRFSGCPDSKTALDDFADYHAVSSYAAEAMSWAVENGVIGGPAGSNLLPAGQVSRAQAAVILMRYLQNTASCI